MYYIGHFIVVIEHDFNIFFCFQAEDGIRDSSVTRVQTCALPISGGKLERADWRRQNVSQLVEQLNSHIHALKPWVKFGVSPFGLGRPDRRPPGIEGFSQYDKLYADAELWLQ